MNIAIEKYEDYSEREILPLYQAVGWTNYANNPAMLENAYGNSLCTLAAKDGQTIIGIVRAVGDGHSIIYIQDLIVLPKFQRRGIGRKLIEAIMSLYGNVYQTVLITDAAEENVSFYRNVGLIDGSRFNCVPFMKINAGGTDKDE